MALENCSDNAQALIDLMSCFAQKQGEMTATFVNNKITDMINLHDVDIDSLVNQIQIINSELAANTTVDGEQTTALQGILDAIAALQTSVANNQTSITAANNAITTGLAGLQASIDTEQARVNSELARIEALIPVIPDPYDDTEVRQLIADNLAAIGSESATRVAEIARLEGLITQNATDITVMKADIASNVTAIANLQGTVAALSTTVTNAVAALNARIDSVEACMTGFFNTLSAASCQTIADAFQAGLDGNGNGGAL